eukprot:TRINITY_DN10197_c0_g1_i5.p1 TRINITY_DN10197_c0_g1~~TRINITY_DN10197_c0_g1_i5.p1  ORF type:complete len:146 (+),score=2.86 TRINITY_DN10197_c0_g1_i5:73-510(+)
MCIRDRCDTTLVLSCAHNYSARIAINNSMEARFCSLHLNRPLECFCWTCQHLVCSYCMRDHKLCRHNAYSLWPSKRSKEQKVAKKMEPLPPIEKLIPRSPTKFFDTDPKPSASQSDLCIKCENPVLSKDRPLRCQHRIHFECLQQ